MALEFYAYHPPEAVPDYWTLEAMSDATLAALPRAYLDWIGIALDQHAGEVEGTCRELDRAVYVFREYVPGLASPWARRSHLTAAEEYQIDQANGLHMRALLRRMEWQQERVASARDRREEAEAQAAALDPPAPLTAQALVAAL